MALLLGAPRQAAQRHRQLRAPMSGPGRAAPRWLTEQFWFVPVTLVISWGTNCAVPRLAVLRVLPSFAVLERHASK